MRCEGMRNERVNICFPITSITCHLTPITYHRVSLAPPTEGWKARGTVARGFVDRLTIGVMRRDALLWALDALDS